MRLFPLHRSLPPLPPVHYRRPVRPPSIPPSLEPKKETARILPEPLRSAQKKTQPLMAMPNVITSEKVSEKDSAADGDA